MPWVGIFARKPSEQTKKAESSSKSIDDDSFDDDSTTSSSPSASSQPQVRALTPAEIEKLQSENEQLRALLAQLAQRAQAESASAPPSSSTDPTAASSSSSPSAPRAFVFQQVDVASMLANAPSAPPLDSSSNTAASSTTSSAAGPPPPVSDFLESLRRSLAQPSGTGSKTAASVPKHDSEEDEDEWGAPSSTSPAAPSSTASAASSHAPAEDEAIVHSKHASVVVHKKPLRRPIDDDEGGTATASAVPAAATNAGLDDFDDDFAGLTTTTAAPTAAGPSSSGDAEGDDSAEEVAVFDLSQADWWYLVPHPDRPGEVVNARPTQMDPNEDEDGFVVVRKNDTSAALGEFLAGVLSRHPGVGRLSPDQLRSMLQSSLESHGLREPSAAGRIWQWGSKAYTVWSYGAWGWSLYKDQTYLRMAAAGAIKAASWIAVFLI